MPHAAAIRRHRPPRTNWLMQTEGAARLEDVVEPDLGTSLALSRSRRASYPWALAACHPFLSIALIGLVARVAAATAIDRLLHGSLVNDDRTFSDLASQTASGASAHWNEFSHFLYHETASLLVPITALYRVFGTHELIGQVFVSLFGVGTALLTYALSRRFVPAPLALAVGLLIAVYPSQVIFSAAILKDALTWCAFAGLACTVVWARDGAWQRVLVELAVVLVTLTFLRYLRTFTVVIVDTALVVSAVLALLLARRRRTRLAFVRLGALVVIGTAFPLVLGLSVFGIHAVPTTSQIVSYRVAQSHGGSAIYHSPSGSASSSSGGPGANSTRLIDQRRGAFSELPKGMLASTLEPFPGQHRSSSKVTMAEAEDVVWYPLCVLALIGLLDIKRYLDDLLFPVILALGLIGADALAEGNLGTAYRHRSDIFWAVALLAGIGVGALARRRGWFQVAPDADQAAGP